MATDGEVKVRLGVEKEGETEAFRELSQEVGRDLPEAARQAGAAMDVLNQALESGQIEGLPTKYANARIEVARYTEEVRRAAAEGQDIGSHGADVQQLGDQWRQSSQKVGEMRAAQQQARRELEQTTAAAGGQVRGFTTLDGALQQLGGRYGTIALKGLAVFQAFETGYAAGTKLRGALNDLTNGGFDRLTQSVLRSHPIIGAWLNNIETSTATLTNAATPALEAAMKAHAAHTEEVAAGAAAQKQFAIDSDLSRDALDKSAASLATNINAFADANQQLSQLQLTTIFGPEIQKLLDLYKRLGVEPPADLAKIARAWGVLDSATAGAVERHRQQVEKMRADLAGAAAAVKQDITAIARALPEALEGVDFDKIRLFDPEQFEKSKATIRSWVEEFRAAGVEIPAALAAAASQVGVLVGAYETATPAVQRLTGAGAASVGPLQIVRDAHGQIVAMLSQVPAAAGAAAGGLTATGTAASGAASSSATAANQIASSMRVIRDEAGKAIGIEGLGALKPAADTAATGIGPAGDKAAAGADGFGAVGTVAADSATELGALLTKAETVAAGMGAVGADLKSKFVAAAAGFTAPLSAELDTLIAKARAARAEILAVLNVEAGGPAEGAVN